MDMQILIVTVAVLASLPLLGTALAMVLGVLVTLRRQPQAEALISRAAWVDALMTWLRAAALWLGSWLEDRVGRRPPRPLRAPAPLPASTLRVTGISERRRQDRRQQARRRYRRSGLERRGGERRIA